MHVRTLALSSAPSRHGTLCYSKELNAGKGTSFTEKRMDWDRVAGNWKQLTGRIKEKWGKLTDDDLTAINGRREQLEGKLQERYGYAKEKAQKEIDDWYDAQAW
jgi:uncharacterized protein YjbJ (UPF0337 family)